MGIPEEKTLYSYNMAFDYKPIESVRQPIEFPYEGN